MTSAAFATKQVRGVTLRADPARESCFTIAHHESEMNARRDHSIESVRSMLHREYNAEAQNCEIAAQMLIDFPEAPWELRMQLARQAWDEARHAAMFLRRVIELGGRKGESPIKNGDWGIVGMIGTLAGRLLVQHRLFEGGVVDTFRQVAAEHRAAGDARTAELFEAILADEIQHVRFANQWLRVLSKQPAVVMQLAKAMAFVAATLEALRPRVGDVSRDGVALVEEEHRIAVNAEDRDSAGFTVAEVATLVKRERADRARLARSA